MFDPISETKKICTQATDHVKEEWNKLPEDVRSNIKGLALITAFTSFSGFAYHFGAGLADTIAYKMRHRN
jgi:hypothetical protein